MSDQSPGTGGVPPGTRAVGTGQFAVLLACFASTKAAGKARRGLDAGMKARGDSLLDSVVFEVDAKHKASDHDPHRVLYATLTPALTWGLFGVLFGSKGIVGGVIWAVIGGVCGGLYGYYSLRLISRRELARIGARLPAPSSALALFFETADPRGMLADVAGHHPSVASVAAVSDDLSARVFSGTSEASEATAGVAGRRLPHDHSSVLSMVALRYPDPATAKEIVKEMALKATKPAPPLQVELVIRDDPGGRRHVAEPTLGVAATSRQSLISWAGFGIVFGAVAGAVNGGGLGGALEGALVTALVWGVFGIFAGALFGLWAGRATSGRRLKSIARLLSPGTSLVLAWAANPVTDETLKGYLKPGSQRLVLRFDPVEGGALLAA